MSKVEILFIREYEWMLLWVKNALFRWCKDSEDFDIPYLVYKN